MQTTSLPAKSEYYDERDSYKRSNFMISSKYKSSLLSNKIMALSLSRISTAQESDGGYLTVTIKGKEIQRVFGARGNSFFGNLSACASQMTGHSIGWSNPETQSFEYIAAVTEATYTNGEFSISFHKKLKKYLTELSHSYTILNLSTMLSFKSVYSFRMFELLKSRCYNRKGSDQNNDKFRVEFDLDELRLDLGIVNSELESVKKILNNAKGKPDYSKAVAVSPEKVHNRWKDMKARCIDPAVKEINMLDTELHIDSYEPLKAGRGGKVYSVVFYVTVLGDKKGKKQEIVDTDEINKDDMIEDIIDLIGKIRVREARAIGDAAGWNMDRIKRNYEYSRGKSVDDIVGFMISAVKDDYASSSKKPRTKVVDPGFKQREYNFEELAKEVM